MLKRIILWGGGLRGRYMSQFMKDDSDYEVVGIVDVDSEILEDPFWTTYDKFSSIDEVKKRAGWDYILPTMRSNRNLNEACEYLTVHEMPFLRINDFCSFTKINHLNSYRCIEVEGYSVYSCEDVFGKDIANGFGFCVYTKDGKLLEESWCHFDHLCESENLLFPIHGKECKYAEAIEDACIVSMEWLGNYHHMLVDSLVRVYAMERIGFKGQYICPDSEIYSFFLEGLRIDNSRIVRVKENSRFNLERVSFVTFNNEEAQAKLIGEMGNILAEIICKDIDLSNYPKRLFVKRKGNRKMMELEEHIVEKYQIKEVIPEDVSFRDQVCFFYAAEVVISPHGANSANLIFMRKGTVFIECFGKSYIAPCLLKTILRKGIRYRMLVEFNGYDSNRDRLTYEKKNDYRISDDLLRVTLSELLGCEQDYER